MTDLTPPGPPPDETSTAPRSGGLPLEEWLAHQQTARGRAPTTPAPYGAASPVASPAPPSKKMAGWALGLSLAWCVPFAFLVGAGLAIAVLVRSRDGRDHGKGRAIAALLISALIVVVNVVYVVVYVVNGVDRTERDADGDVVGPGVVTLDRLRHGDCYNDADLLEADPSDITVPAEVEVVPCSYAHDFEVFAVFDLPDGDYPGDADVDARTARCFDEFTTFNGRRWRPRSGLDFMIFMPTSASWRLGDRSIVCSIFELDGTRAQGSLEGAHR